MGGWVKQIERGSVPMWNDFLCYHPSSYNMLISILLRYARMWSSLSMGLWPTAHISFSCFQKHTDSSKLHALRNKNRLLMKKRNFYGRTTFFRFDVFLPDFQLSYRLAMTMSHQKSVACYKHTTLKCISVGCICSLN